MNSTASVGKAPVERNNEIGWKTIAVGASISFVLAFAVRMANFQHPPITDELYHLLAAASWAADGSLAIAEGEYLRASAFTKLIGVIHAMSDGNLDAIRLFGILIGSLLVAAVFAWSRRFVGSVDAVIAATMLALMPGAVFLSQHIRFYSLHSLTFFAVAVGVYSLVLGRVSGVARILIIACLLFLILLGVHLQVTTLIGISGIVLWVFVVKYAAIFDWFRVGRLRLPIFGIAIAGVLAILVLNGSAVSDLLRLYQSSAMWNSGDGPTFYHDFYRNQLGAFWSLAPAAFVIAVLVRPLPAIFCACIFVVAFIVQSFGGMRGERFLFYAMPFFFIIWGIAISAVGRILIRFITDAVEKSGPTFLRAPSARALPTAIVIAIFGFLMISTPAVVMTAKMVTGRPVSLTKSPVYWDRYRTDWQGASSFLRDLGAKSQVTIVSQALHSQYYLGGFDYALSATALADVISFGVTDGVDPRTGRPVIDSPDALTSILDCNKSGMVVIHEPAWRNPSRVNSAAADFIESNMKLVEVPDDWGLLVFSWQSLRGDCQSSGPQKN